MMTNSEWVNDLLYLAEHRVTYYDNSFPANCGEINADGSLSFDCIGLVKSTINDPKIAYRTGPAGYYVKPGQVVPDGLDEIGLLRSGTGITWGTFDDMIHGEYVYMNGHAGVYFAGSANYNIIECTPAWTGGVQKSWMDPDGTRRNVRGGWPCGKWEAHSQLYRWIRYTDKPKTVKFKYKVYVDNLDLWLPSITNTQPDESGDNFAGISGDDIKCVIVKCNKGSVRYAVHTWKGGASERYKSSKWLPEVKNADGYAGITNQPADAFILFSDRPAKYRVRLRKTGEWLPWVKTKDANYKDKEKGYAGIIGQPFDGLQIRPLG